MRQYSDKHQLLIGLLAGILAAATALAAPSAPLSITVGPSSSFNASQFADVSVNALAGNITALTINGVSQTRAWQGYYGNITGTITLDDAENFTFYNWTDAEPRGQIYASLQAEGTPTWASVQCFSLANNASAFHTTYNISAADGDNVTNTYTLTNHDTFYIDSNLITGCPTTYIWRDDLQQSNAFTNVLLWDSAGSANAWLFATLIENRTGGNDPDISCYNSQDCDFQLLVAEDGHGTDTAPTAYYFWVDLAG